MPQFTDYFNNPINVGDVVVYPTCQGSSSAEFKLAVVRAIDEIVPENPSNPKSRFGYLYKDRLKEYPTQYVIPGRWVPDPTRPPLGDLVRDDSKAYALQVTRVTDSTSPLRTPLTDKERERVIRVKNVDRVIVVTSIAGPVA